MPKHLYSVYKRLPSIACKGVIECYMSTSHTELASKQTRKISYPPLTQWLAWLWLACCNWSPFSTEYYSSVTCILEVVISLSKWNITSFVSIETSLGSECCKIPQQFEIVCDGCCMQYVSVLHMLPSMCCACWCCYILSCCLSVKCMRLEKEISWRQTGCETCSFGNVLVRVILMVWQQQQHVVCTDDQWWILFISTSGAFVHCFLQKNVWCIYRWQVRCRQQPSHCLVLSSAGFPFHWWFRAYTPALLYFPCQFFI